MKQHADTGYSFGETLPVEPVGPGTNLLVTGPSASGARDVGLRMVLAGADDQGRLLISTDVGGRALLRRCGTVPEPPDRDSLAIVDCSGRSDSQKRFGTHLSSISSPGDLTAIELELSVLYEKLVERELDRIRLGLFSVTSVLTHADFTTASRFLHMLTGRVIATGDLGVFVVDTDLQDDREVDVVEGFCDGRVDVRAETAGTRELRVVGLDDQPGSWMPFTLETDDEQV